MEADKNLAAADNGSPGEGKNEALSDFFYDYNDMILRFEPSFVNYDEQTEYYKIIQILRALWLTIKPFYMSVCTHGFRSSLISYFIKEM